MNKKSRKIQKAILKLELGELHDICSELPCDEGQLCGTPIGEVILEALKLLLDVEQGKYFIRKLERTEGIKIIDRRDLR